MLINSVKITFDCGYDLHSHIPFRGMAVSIRS
jgi:hypothetical protein